MNRRRVFTILAALALALFGMFVIVAYVNAAEERAQEGSRLVPVLVAAEEIDAGTAIADLGPLVTTEEVPERLRQADAVRNLEDHRGQVTVSPVRAGEQIVARQFGEPDEVRSGSGSQIKKGKEIVSVALEPQRAVGGRLAAGDLVSVIVSVDEADAQSDADPSQSSAQRKTTGLVLNKIPVTAVTGGVTDESGETANAVLVSLEVDGSDAERIVFGMEHGSVWLTLNGNNVEPPNEQIRSPENIYELGGG